MLEVEKLFDLNWLRGFQGKIVSTRPHEWCEAEMNLSPGKPRYLSSDVENGFSTGTNRDFFSTSNSCLLLQEINSAREWTMLFSLPQHDSNCLTVPLHCWPAAACSLCCFAGYSLNSRPDSAHLILCLVLSTLLHVVDKLEKM